MCNPSWTRWHLLGERRWGLPSSVQTQEIPHDDDQILTNHRKDAVFTINFGCLAILPAKQLLLQYYILELHFLIAISWQIYCSTKEHIVWKLISQHENCCWTMSCRNGSIFSYQSVGPTKLAKACHPSKRKRLKGN